MAQEGLRTHRGHTLLFSQRELLLTVPVLTVELYCKWYELWVVHPNLDLMTVSFMDLEEHWAGFAFVDHTPNPGAVRNLAEAKGWYLNELADELITGRWKLEVEDNS